MRSWVLDEIEKLDAEKDHFRITHLSGYYEFPWDTTRALEFALYRTFAVGSIGELLDRTQEFANRTQKRYDDTDLILSEILEHGYESDRGKAAIRRMNEIHRRFNISNEDYLYVLSTFVMEPHRWVDRFGKRKVTRKEKEAGFYLWKEIGKRMGIRDIPSDFDTFEQFNIDYEKKHFRFTNGGRQVALATENLMLGWFLPRFLFGIGRPFLRAVMDEALLEAFRFRRPPIFVRLLSVFGLKSRAFFLRLLPTRRRPKFRTSRNVSTYPKGYQIENLGPPV